VRGAKHWIELEVLPAGYGDALVVRYGRAGDPATHTIVVDGGPPEESSLQPVGARLRQLSSIDLLVVTHVDVDHIGGMVKLLEDPAIAGAVKSVWFNCFKHLQKADDWLGGIDGELLTTQILALGVPWNDGFALPVDTARGVGGPVVVPPITSRNPQARLPRMPLPGGATAIVVSPGAEQLVKLAPKWAKAVEAAGLVPGRGATREAGRKLVGSDWLGKVDLAAEAASAVRLDRAEANGSSIAFVLCWGDLRLLLAGDAHAGVLADGLRRLVAEGDDCVQADGRVRVDACKLPHHGSAANLSTEVVGQLDCRDWIVSSNGKRFHHPNDAALARVVTGSTQRVRIVGNYPSTRMASWQALAPPADHGYDLLLPAAGAEGVVLRYPAD
jgi:beta-lactamase superfamily II metal-dependent hydrolase